MFKVGDKVKVKKWNELTQVGQLSAASGIIQFKSGNHAVPYVKTYQGKTGIVQKTPWPLANSVRVRFNSEDKELLFAPETLDLVDKKTEIDPMAVKAGSEVITGKCAATMLVDDVCHRADHYSRLNPQVIQYAQQALTPEEFQGAMKFNILKYTLRMGHKAGQSAAKEATKISDYAKWLLESIKGQKVTV